MAQNPALSPKGGGKANLEGLNCELKAREFRYNSKGDRVLLSGERRRAWEIPKDCDQREALILNRYYDKKGHLDYTEMEIHSPHIMTALRKINLDPRGRHGLNLDTSPIVCREFERYIFHIRHELQQQVRTMADAGAVAHIELMLQYLDKSLHREIRTYYNHVEGPFLTPGLDFEHLWMAFRPGEEIYCNRGKQVFIGRFISMTKHCPTLDSGFWLIAIDTITYDGINFGYEKEFVHVNRYKGYRPFEDLNILPLKYHPKRQVIRDNMIQRGRKFISLYGMHHCEYRGIAQVLEPFLKESDSREDEYPLRDMMINGRIIIEGSQFTQERPNHKPRIEREIETESNALSAFDEDDLLICQATLMGFSLAEKLWGFFYAEYSKEVEYDDDAFRDLRLPNEQKQIILSLVAMHEKKTGLGDIIKGKGKGTVMLFHGPPGTGKTLTAESVAESSKKPLYSMSVGNLGTDPERMELIMTTALLRASVWNSIVVIDEAEVFMEQRSFHDIRRNALVSVFLRVLEYHEGIVILTTNRVGVFDTAFKSRVHLAIHYTTLDVKIRRELWQMFLQKVISDSQSGDGWVDRELDRLASFNINGREIKNSVMTARGIAIGEDAELSINHVNMVLKYLQKFEADFTVARAQISPEEVDPTADGNISDGNCPAKKRRRR